MPYSPADHLAAIDRTVATVTRGERQLRLVTANRTFDATPTEVWDALVTPDRIPRWFVPITGDLRVGGRFQLEGNAGGEVLECREPERLSVTWEFGGQTSWVDVTLRPTDAGTLLQLDHALAVDDHYRRFGPGATGTGWEMCLMELGEHLAAPGAPRPAPEQLPDLSEYFAMSGAAWADAAVAAGDDPVEAKAAAARCVAAYRGEDPGASGPGAD